MQTRPGIILAALIGLTLIAGRGALAANPFLPVLIDDKSEKALGQFPFDRSLIARAVDRAADAGAKGVVLQFFFDHPRSTDGDHELAAAMSRTKVVVEAHIDDTQQNPNLLPERFTVAVTRAPADSSPRLAAIGGGSGWIPLPIFTGAASGVGFVDMQSADHPPMLEWYRGGFVKSLTLCALELAVGPVSHIQPGVSLQIGGKNLKMDLDSQAATSFPGADRLEFISFSDFLGGGVLREQMKDRVVIIGYQGDKSAVVKTPLGNIPPHRAFIYGLQSLYDQVTKN